MGWLKSTLSMDQAASSLSVGWMTMERISGSRVLNSSQPVMVDFFANWCGPCQMLGPVIANLAEEYAGKIKIGKINVDENPGVAQMYDVATIPNLVFFKDGKVVNRVIGVVPDNVLKEKLDALLR